MGLCRSFIIFLLAFVVPEVRLQIVRNNVGLEVANGRMEYLRKDLLSFNVQPGQTCKVEVITNEPMYQRVGIITPEIFDCDYLPNSVRYEHNGSPFLFEDTVKMRAYVLLANQTLQETFYLDVTILNSRCDIIQINHVTLTVPRMTRVSNPITRDVVDFDYDREFDNSCQVRIIRGTLYDFPAHGQLVIPDNTSSPREMGRDPQYEVAGSIMHSCEDFVLMGLRYEHLTPPTPNVDYIPIHVVITDTYSGTVLRQERHWLPVTIIGAIPNQPPKASFSNMYILEVDQFVITNLLPMTISAVDGETHSEKLIFNITKPPSQGFITHLSDESKPIGSFWQQDLQGLQIAYQPPNISYPERQTFEVEFVVFDAYFSSSQPMKCLLSVRVAYTNAPRISWNKGLAMLEGQSRSVNHDCLQVVDKDNLHQVRFTLAGGLQHGRLYVNNRPGYTFRWNDIENGIISYRHDDTDTRKDHVTFRVSDGVHSTRFKLPISILPKDDAPPFLINNIVFQVKEGQTILIHRFMLEASDADSSADYIRFNITTPPVAGEVQKRRKTERGGWSVNTFQQSDLYQGLIYYKHLGSEVFEDSFEFTLADSCRPEPNISPTQRVTIKITPVNDLPPQPAPGNSLALTVNETEVVHVTSAELHYIDVEQEDSDVTYMVTTGAYRLDGTGQDAGRLIFTDDMVMLMKDPTVPTLRTFTQSAVNHQKVAYMPPIQDVGLYPVDVELLFSVSDDGGKQITGQRFAITILPVDNMAPTIQVTEMCLNEGGTAIIAADLILIQDGDTLPANLRIILSKQPLTGNVRRDGIPLQSGNSFTFQEVEQFRMTYVHNGSEIHKDQFELTVSDGKQNSSTVMPVKMEPVDDEQPILLENGSGPLNVPERGSTALSEAFLSATDIDTDDMMLIFDVLSPPQYGDIIMNGEPVLTFVQRDIIIGQVYYRHTGPEIGKTSLEDLATVMVSDRQGLPADLQGITMKTKDLHFTIVPVNNRPPRVALGHRVFRCNEGEVEAITHHFLMADDEDSPVNDLTYLVTSAPTFGYLEDMTPEPGYEKTIGKPTTSFTHVQLMSGYIRYKQSEHEGIEPTSDQFSILVTDGQFRSAEVPFLISINPANDEEPIISVENVTCEEGHMQPLTLHIEDLDIPNDEVMITIVQPPTHGMVMDEMTMLSRHRRSSAASHTSPHRNSNPMHDMEPMTEFSLHQLQDSMVIPAYMHDGSEYDSDVFELKISDGRHIKRKSLMVNVIPVNDERPVISRNEGTILELGESRIISSVALQTIDEDTPTSELVYELHSLPRRGNLQLKIEGEETNWVDLQYADTFTEYDVELNRLRYKHASVLGSKGQDTFRFSVTDGDFTSPRQNFVIQIEHTKKSAVHVVTHPLHVNERQQAFITTDILMARDDSQNPQEIMYDVIRTPAYGQIEYVSFPDVPIEMFTQLDLLARNVIYSHTSKVDTPVDSFRVLANNGLKSREADVTILIQSIDAELPTLIIGGDSESDSPALESADLTLYSGSSVAISNMILKIQDPDSSKENLKLAIVEFPQHGTLTVGQAILTESNNLVSEIDLENADFIYQHSDDGAQIDRFTFTVTDGIHTGYIYQGARMQEPTVFNLRIETLDETPPILTVNQQPNSIEPISRGRTPNYGIFLDSHVLRADDVETSNPSDITFTVTSLPSYGILQMKSNSHQGDEGPLVHFTQADLNMRGVMYVVSSKLQITNDSFMFDVEDSWGNTLYGNRFVMSWSRIEIVQPKLKVCESTGTVTINMRRYGNLMTSSFVGILIKSGSAKVGIDFVPSTALQVQFDPNVRHQTWQATVVNDSLEERKEKFSVKLHTPVNTVLSPRKISTVVIIVDESHKTCSGRKVRRKSRTRKTRRRKKIKKKSKHPLNILRDSPRDDIDSNLGRTKTKYGKLGHGATVQPSSYFRNESVRIWTYHGLLPVTIDETDSDDLPRSVAELMASTSVSGRLGTNSVSQSQNLRPIRLNRADEQLNDDPNALLNHGTLYEGRINVENSNSSAMITVHGRNDRVNSNNPGSNVVSRSSSQSINQACVLARRGGLFYDSVARVLYQCDGAQWVTWKPPRTLAKARKAHKTSAIPTCGEGWKAYEDRCFLIGSSDDHTASWNSAQRICRERHSANLVSIHSRKQLNWLWKVARKSQFWIGLNRKLNPREWEWVNGDDVTFINWKRAHPRSTVNGEDCSLVASRKKWVDTSCTEEEVSIKYICVKNP